MALSANTVWECRTTGNANNGGGFVTGAAGTDYSQQAAAQYTAADLVVDGADNTKVTSASHNFVTADVGNLLHVTAGAGWTPGFYEILSVSSNAAFLDRSPAGVGVTDGTYYVGGALATPENVAGQTAGNIIYVKADGTYTLSGAWATGAVLGTLANPIKWIGYTTTRGDNGRATISAGTNSITCANGFIFVLNFDITGSAAPVLANSSGLVYNCKVTNNSGTANRIAINPTSSYVLNCEAISTNGYAISISTGNTTILGCYTHDSVSGIRTPGVDGNTIIRNIVDTCTTGLDINNGSDGIFIHSNTVYNCTTGVLLATSHSKIVFMNNLIANCTTGFSIGATINSLWINYNGWASNTADISGASKGANDVTAVADFVDAPNADFRIGNNFKALGFPGAFTGAHANCIGYLDIGAVQKANTTTTAIGIIG